MASEADEPQEDSERPFRAFWDAYTDTSYPIGTTGALWGQCRDAADELLRGLGLTEPSTKRTAAVRILSCLILDGYENDRWDYPHD